MKMKYEKPVLFAEGYTFADSIADCKQHVGDPDQGAKIVYADTVVCAHDNGHKAGKGLIKDFPTTIFNDGATNWDGSTTNPTGCDYDWNGNTGTFKGETLEGGGTFYTDFLGSNPNDKEHFPAYNGEAFWS